MFAFSFWHDDCTGKRHLPFRINLGCFRIWSHVEISKHKRVFIKNRDSLISEHKEELDKRGHNWCKKIKGSILVLSSVCWNPPQRLRCLLSVWCRRHCDSWFWRIILKCILNMLRNFVNSLWNFVFHKRPAISLQVQRLPASKEFYLVESGYKVLCRRHEKWRLQFSHVWLGGNLFLLLRYFEVFDNFIINLNLPRPFSI